jgi:hypothetical protein
MACWLDKVGGLMMGSTKVYGDTEITRAEYAALFEFEPHDRHAALPILRRQPEYEAAAEAHATAVVDEIAASDEVDKARAAYETFKAAHAAAAQLDPNAPEAPKVELEAAADLANETENKYRVAAEKAQAAQAKLDELTAVVAMLPPRRSVAV